MDETKKKCIYMLTSPSNKIYVGKTINRTNRFRQHRYACTKTDGFALFHALKKYGWDSFTKTILEIFEDDATNKQMSQRERHWIKEKNAFGPNGYNMTEGGEGAFGRKMNEKTRTALLKVNSVKGRIHTAEARANMSKAQKRRNDNMTKEERAEARKRRNCNMTQEERAERSKSYSDRVSDQKVPVIATEKKTGAKWNFESAYHAMRVLTREFGKQFNRAHISSCANKRPYCHSHMGWTFDKGNSDDTKTYSTTH